MAYGPIQVFTCGIASGASTSSYINLGKSHPQIAINAVTMSTAAMITVYGSNSPTGTFGPIYEKVQNTAASAYLSLTVGTATSGGWCLIDPAPPFQYLLFVTSAVVSGGVSITVLAND